MRGLETTYGSVTVPFTSNTASSSIMATASGGGGMTTTTSPSLSYTPLETVVGGTDPLAVLGLGGATPILENARTMDSPGYMTRYNLGSGSGLGSAMSTPSSTVLTPSHIASTLNTPTIDPRVSAAEDVDDTIGKGNNDDNENI